MRKYLLFIWIVSCIFFSPLQAAELKNQQPGTDMMNIEADRLDVYSEQNQAVFSGNVVATREGLVLRSRVLTVYFRESERSISRLVAEEKVYIRMEDKETTCDRADYHMDDRVIMTGNVQITRGNEHLTGQKVTVDLTTGRQVVEGGGNRVKLRVNTEQEGGILNWEN